MSMNDVAFPPVAANEYLRASIVRGILLGVLICSVDVIGDALLNWIETEAGPSLWSFFMEEAFSPSLHEVWIRMMVIAVCIGFRETPIKSPDC